MSNDKEPRIYLRTECAVFRKTAEAFGGLSNMAPGYPVRVNGVIIFTVEALYQACRFPHMVDVQRKIIGQHSPMTAKMVSKPYRKDSRPDWDRVRVKVMRWCLRMKLTQHWPKFSQLLLSTGDRSIVEDSRKDGFWGAVPSEGGTLVGMNVLGRLLMELRETIKQGAELRRVEPPAIADFLLFGEPLQVVDFRTAKNAPVVVEEITAKYTYDELTLPLFAEAGAAAPSRAAVTATALRNERSQGMIEGLKAYPKYKDSRQAWLGDVPANWSLLPNRALFDEVKDRDHPEEEMLSVTITRGIVRQKALLENSSKKDSSNTNKSAYKLIYPGDIAYNKMRAWQGALGASSLRGIISPAYVVMRPRKEANARFFHYLYRTALFAKEAERWSYGITSDMWSLRPEHFKVIGSVLPPLDEQLAIVRFLDHANRKIDGFIRAKRKLIGLLNEQKQAIIHRAVTRGLDPNAKLKPSGIPWLGEIPAHWGIVRNMALFSHRVESGIAGLPVLQVSLRSGITAEELDQFGRPKKLIADPTKYKLIRKADMSYNTMRMWQGAVGVAPTDGLVSPAYVVLKPRQSTYPEFYDFVFHTEVYKQQVNRQSTGIVSDRNRLYWDSFKQMPNLTLPCAEQEKIVAFIASETIPLTTAIARTEREIALMQEYRTRLTADIVTGKLDVREAAAKLPVEKAEEIVESDLSEDETELEEIES